MTIDRFMLYNNNEMDVYEGKKLWSGILLLEKMNYK